MCSCVCKREDRDERITLYFQRGASHSQYQEGANALDDSHMYPKEEVEDHISPSQAPNFRNMSCNLA